MELNIFKYKRKLSNDCTSKKYNFQFCESLAQAVNLGTIVYEFMFIIMSLEDKVQWEVKLLVIAETAMDFKTS